MAERKQTDVSHDGHRKRVKERYLTTGLKGFSSHEVLEFLLFYGIPYKDTNGLAHRLDDSFGGLANVLEADYADLMKVQGVTPHVATLLSLCGDVCRRYYSELNGRVTHLHDDKALSDYIKPWFFGQREESVLLISLDNKRKLLNGTRIFEGSVNSSVFNIRTVVQQALRDNATKVVLAHNHPNGFAFPSREDYDMTRQLMETLAPLDIRLIDHVIVSENECISMAELSETANLFTAQ